MNLPGRPSPGYLAALQSMPAPGALPPPRDLGEIDQPALPPGIDPSWLRGQAPNPAALGGSGIPGVNPIAPGPTMPQQQPMVPVTDLGELDAPPGPAGPPAPVAAAPQPAAPAAPRSFLQQVHGAGSYTAPAHETELRGPQLKAAETERNAAFAGAVKAVTERSEQTAAGDFAVALDAERKAGIREDVANYTAAERGQEMEQRTADFDQSVRAMGEAGTIDQSRFFSSASTGQKLAMMVSLFVGGLAEAKGARNTGAEAIRAIAANDVKAQEFAYNATKDQANAKQTAFSMAMQKFNNADAARAAARAASLDVITAQMGQQAALWKGTEAANRANMAIAQLQDERMNQIRAGVAFTPAKTVGVGASYVDPRTGLTYSEGEAKGLVKTMDANEFEREKIGLNTAGDVIKEQAKGAGKDDKELGVETRAISAQLQQAGVPQARAAAETALAALNKDPGGKLEAFDRSITPDALGHAAHSDAANAREQAYSKFSNAAVKAIMGNATEQERARMVEDLGRASDPESRRRAIKNVMTDLEAIEKNAHAGASPAAQEAFKKRRELAEGAPPTAPKGSKAGW